MPPNSSQTGRFPFANNCPSAQTFRVTAQPPSDWLRFEPSTVNVGPGTSFGVRVTVNTSGHRTLGKYRSSLLVVCTSCAATLPPCLLEAREFPISLTIADIKVPREFEPTAAPAPAVSQVKPQSLEARPAIYIPPDPPAPTFMRFFPLIAGGLLAAAVVGIILAYRGLSARQKTQVDRGDLGAESIRHQVRR